MDEKLFSARVNDLAELADKTSSPQFFGFLTEEEYSNSIKILKNRFRHCYYGGYDDAERTMLCLMPDWCESPNFPITAVTFSYNSNYNLTHRDFLGALMSLGITRESVGDILVESGRTVVFLKNQIVNFVITQISKVGSVGVNLKLGFSEPLPQKGVLVSCTDTVSSMRLDCVVSAVCGVSRNSATELIEASKVSVNSVFVEKTTKTINEGDTLTVRGKGKIFIVSASEHTKKGRIVLNYNKYK